VTEVSVGNIRKKKLPEREEDQVAIDQKTA
jgi:hypothetical protein